MEMIERVARAIEKTYEDFADPTPAQRARAAIEAMREPTEEMMRNSHSFGHLEGWQSMIDAALNPPQPAESKKP